MIKKKMYTDEDYIEYCHDIIDYLESKFINVVHDNYRLRNLLTIEQLKKYQQETERLDE